MAQVGYQMNTSHSKLMLWFFCHHGYLPVYGPRPRSPEVSKTPRDDLREPCAESGRSVVRAGRKWRTPDRNSPGTG